MKEQRYWVDPPAQWCPKCGEWEGFDHPEYRESSFERDEHFVWPCKKCGYEAITPTLEQLNKVATP